MKVAALVIAIYAAVTGTAALGWRVFTWWRDRRLDVLVKLDEVRVHRDPDLPEVSERVFRLTVVNRSAFPVRVTGATLIPADERSVRSFFTGGDDLRLPCEVRPRDAQVLELSVSSFIGQLPDGTVAGWI